MSFQYYDLIKVLFLNDAMPVCELQWVTTQAKRNVRDMFRWHACARLLGALSKEVRRRKCSNCLTPTITKQSNLIPWSSYLHLCVVSTCLPPLNIWWCLQLSPNISNVFHIWQGSWSLEEILGDCLNRRPNNQPLFFSRLSGWQDLTNCNRIHLQLCSSAIKMMDHFDNRVNEVSYHLNFAF